MTGQEYSSSISAAFSRLRRYCARGFAIAPAIVVIASAIAIAVPFAVAFSALPKYAHAQSQSGDSKGLRIGIVDMRSVLRDSDAIKAIRETLDEKNKSIQKEIAAEETSLRETEKKLTEAKNNVSEAEFRKRLGEFEQRVIALQRRIQTEKSNFDRAYSDAQSRIERELLTVVSEIAKEKGFDMVLDRKNAVLYDKALDISGEASKRLNERTKNIKVTFETKKSGGNR